MGCQGKGLEGGIKNRHEETFGGHGYAHYLNCGNRFKLYTLKCVQFLHCQLYLNILQ